MKNRGMLIRVETEIKQLVGSDPELINITSLSAPDLKKLRELLSERQKQLNLLFPWTPVNTARIKQVNCRLGFLSASLRERVTAMQSKAKFICDNPEFDDDYEIEGTLSYNWNDSDSVLILDDDSAYGSDFNLMIAVIDSFLFNYEPVYKNILRVYPNSETIDENFSWNESPLVCPEINICYATHYICCHSYYSIPDLLRLNDFWAEVKFVEQSITTQDGTRFSKKN